MKVGITGQSGFIGTHLATYVENRSDLKLMPFEDGFFDDDIRLRSFVKQCDVIVHLAAASRMPSEEDLYNLNVGLVQKIIDAMEAEEVRPHVVFSSSTHETRDTAYGRAKLEGRKRFEGWARRNGACADILRAARCIPRAGSLPERSPPAPPRGCTTSPPPGRTASRRRRSRTCIPGLTGPPRCPSWLRSRVP